MPTRTAASAAWTKAKHTLDEIIKLSPENLTVHTLALKRSSRLVTEGEKYPMPEAEEVEHMVHMGSEAATRLGMRPYYMYRQKYMSAMRYSRASLGSRRSAIMAPRLSPLSLARESSMSSFTIRYAPSSRK